MARKKIKLVDIMSNNNENSRLADINQLKPITSNQIFYNKLLSKLTWNFKENMFSKSEISVDISVLDIRYMYNKI